MMEAGLMTLNTKIQRNETKFLANALGEEMVMMNMENGDFVSMNKVGADIWKLTQEPVEVSEVIQKLLDLYDINAEQCSTETLAFLESSMKQNMFTVAE
jgi:hypothetical protein